MKIRTQLIIIMVFFGLALLIISASVIATNQQVERLNKQEELAKKIELEVGELSYLSNDYLLYHESQQIDRWESKYSSISEDISNLAVDRPEQQTHIDNIKTSQLRLKDIFDDVASKSKSAPALGQNTVDPAFIQVSWSRMGVQIQGIIFEASRLSQMLREQADGTKQSNNMLILILIGAFIAFLLTDYILIFRGTLKSISILQAGTRIIGAGNLDYSIVEKKDDEIGELAQAFNQMTANLKSITASKSDLEKQIVERTQAENELRKAEENVRMTLNSITDRFFGLDKEWRYTQFNEQAKKQLIALGKNPEDMIGKVLWEEFPGAPVEETFRHAMRDRVALTHEHYYPPLGEWVENRVYPTEDGGLAVFQQYITERKQAEAEIQKLMSSVQQEKDRLLTLVNSIPDEVWFADAQKKISLVNPAVLNEFGNSTIDLADVEAIAGSSEVYRPDGTPRPVEEAPPLRALNGEIIRNQEEIVRTPASGELRYRQVNAGPVKDADGNIIGSVSVVRDITQRKQAEEKLRLAYGRLQTFFDHRIGGIGIVIANANGNILQANDYYLSILGFTRDELISGRVDWRDMTPPEWLPADERALAQLQERGVCDTYEKEYMRRDGSRVPVLITDAMMPGDHGEILAFVLDNTERKQAEQALHKAKDELELRVAERTTDLTKANVELTKAKDAAEAAVEAKAAFLANMSHELRTPMNAVIGFSSLLLDDNLTPDQKDYVERIRIGGEALLALINDVLDFSKMEKSKVKIEHQPLSLRHCIEEALGMVAVKANDRGLNLSYTISYGTPDTVVGDHGRLRQVLLNLLSNAVKFTDQGEVSVSVSSKAIEGNKHSILFAVRDTGIGIPEEKVGMLFQPFSQLEYNLSLKRDGTGLGLAISKNLVELMGGEIWADSTPGEGSIFHFTIEAEVAPGKLVDSGRPANAAYENLAEKKPLRILVAEDVPSNQMVLVEMLKRMGYRADMAADGREVLQALELMPYDLVLMDIQMPEMDGLKAAQEIRKRWPVWPKIIAITAYALEGDREKCIEAGMDDYIAKPVKKDDLAALLRNITPPPE